MILMKCRIFVDTNPIWDDKGPFGTLFSPSFVDLPEFLKKHYVKNTSICLPLIVIRERIQQRKELIESAIGYINERIKSIQEAGHEEKEIDVRNDYEEKLTSYAEEFCKKHNVEIIPQPSVSVEELTNLAINKNKPFNDHGSGFKDTLIYLSMVEDAKNNKGDSYILCTKNNTQFDKELIEDFKKQTGKELQIIPDLVSVQQKLDEIVPLGLHLEKRNTEIKNIALSNIGELMKSINRGIGVNNYNSANHLLWTGTDQLLWNINSVTATQEEKSEVVGYNFRDMNFSSIEETSKDEIQVSVNITTDVVYKDDIDITTDPFSFSARYKTPGVYLSALHNPYGINILKPSTRDFSFNLSCNPTTKSVSILSMNNGLFY